MFDLRSCFTREFDSMRSTGVHIKLRCTEERIVFLGSEITALHRAGNMADANIGAEVCNSIHRDETVNC